MLIVSCICKLCNKDLFLNILMLPDWKHVSWLENVFRNIILFLGIYYIKTAKNQHFRNIFILLAESFILESQSREQSRRMRTRKTRFENCFRINFISRFASECNFIHSRSNIDLRRHLDVFHKCVIRNFDSARVIWYVLFFD